MKIEVSLRRFRCILCCLCFSFGLVLETLANIPCIPLDLAQELESKSLLLQIRHLTRRLWLQSVRAVWPGLRQNCVGLHIRQLLNAKEAKHIHLWLVCELPWASPWASQSWPFSFPPSPFRWFPSSSHSKTWASHLLSWSFYYQQASLRSPPSFQRSACKPCVVSSQGSLAKQPACSCTLWSAPHSGPGSLQSDFGGAYQRQVQYFGHTDDF